MMAPGRKKRFEVIDIAVLILCAVGMLYLVAEFVRSAFSFH